MAETGKEAKKHKTKSTYSGGGGMVYVLGLFGALIYFIQHAESFWIGALGVLQAFVWPAIVVYELLEMLLA